MKTNKYYLVLSLAELYAMVRLAEQESIKRNGSVLNRECVLLESEAFQQPGDRAGLLQIESSTMTVNAQKLNSLAFSQSEVIP